MVNIVRAGRHLVKVVFFVSTRRRYENHRIFLWKCILGQTTVVYEKFCEDWSIFHKVTALTKWGISWPRPSDIVNQKVMILITFHCQSLINPCSKFQEDRTKALGGVHSNTTPSQQFETQKMVIFMLKYVTSC